MLLHLLATVGPLTDAPAAAWIVMGLGLVGVAAWGWTKRRRPQ